MKNFSFKNAIAALHVTAADESEYMEIASAAMKDYTSEPATLSKIFTEQNPVRVSYNVFAPEGKREVSVLINDDGSTAIEDNTSDLDHLHNDIALRDDNEPESTRVLARESFDDMIIIRQSFDRYKSDGSAAENLAENAANAIVEDIDEAIKYPGNLKDSLKSIQSSLKYSWREFERKINRSDIEMRLNKLSKV